ncbi:hypothetical protein IQ247_15930 [Plectonema cf. radiosum LEGE 06105]|uniref:Uncharacterized protein n=1 Tax=Plectonema cf. radiosum LEGE 06105 TaxID=945769 RepID=A0A8J7K3G9_9CYAN|nr:hypothetical protein [Plectonema radiosum]MBE9214137.1 hypothetical protein [Plectonema cf. radiosum LEGE 06105]
MKIQPEYSAAELYKLQTIKNEIESLRKQLIEIDQEVGEIKQNFPYLEKEQAKTYSPEFSHKNNFHPELLEEENVEKPWGNYILVVLIVFYFVVMSFL